MWGDAPVTFAQFLIATIWLLLVLPTAHHAKHMQRSGVRWGLLALTLSPVVAFVCLWVIGRRIVVPAPLDADIPDDPDYVFTLVHGTFVPDATWILPNSWFSSKLKGKLKARTFIVPFRWNGKNRALARTEAAHQLAEHIESVARRFPHAQHYLVAHSHGGSVAVEALHYCPKGVRPTGITTLSTPFIQLTPTPTQSLDRLWMFSVAVHSAIVYAVLSSGLVGLGILVRWMGRPSLELAFAVVAGAALFASLLLVQKRGLWGSPSRPDTLPLTAPPDVNLLIIRSSGDEASAGLATSQILAWLTKRVMQACIEAALAIITPDRRAIMNEKLAASLGGVTGFTAVYLCVFAFRAWLGELSLSVPETDGFVAQTLSSLGIIGRAVLAYINWIKSLLFPYGFWLGMILSGISVGFGLLAFGLARLTTVILVPFGGWQPLLTFRASLSVESTPHGTWLLHHLPIRMVGDGSALAHSFSYDDERVVDLIAEWAAGSVQAHAATS